jgi:hypothetical protein
VIGRALFQPVAQKRPHREAVLTARGNRSFARQVLEKAHHEHLQIHHRINPGSSAPALFAIGRRTQRPDLPRKIHRCQMLVELAIKTLAFWLRHSRALDPKLSLLLFNLSLRKRVRFYFTASKMATFSTVC